MCAAPNHHLPMASNLTRLNAIETGLTASWTSSPACCPSPRTSGLGWTSCLCSASVSGTWRSKASSTVSVETFGHLTALFRHDRIFTVRATSWYLAPIVWDVQYSCWRKIEEEECSLFCHLFCCQSLSFCPLWVQWTLCKLKMTWQLSWDLYLIPVCSHVVALRGLGLGLNAPLCSPASL